MAVEFTTNYATGCESLSFCDQNPVETVVYTYILLYN